MREIKAELIKNTVARLAQRANVALRAGCRQALCSALRKETNSRAKKILKAIIENARIAKAGNLAICQDTGLPVVFARIGQNVHIAGGLLTNAINRGIKQGYRQGFLRDSIIRDPVLRGKPGFVPAVIHIDMAAGKRLRLTVLPKGFGCENKSRVKMFNPTASLEAIKAFIVQVVKEAGPDACPPFVVGVGIGGTQDYACLLAKKALLRPVARRPHSVVRYGIRNTEYLPAGRQAELRRIESELLRDINKLNIGPMGLGGKTTCLGVNIETYPTHIAGLPLAVNISCHALRSATAVV